jgi:sugar lactone lactonase YvrE
MVWPNQDYFNLTWARIEEALSNSEMRTALWQIWLNRDYSRYAQVAKETGFSISEWNPSDKMQLFIRKDVAAKIWDYGIIQKTAGKADPYEQGRISLSSDLVIGIGGESDGQFNSPHGFVIAPDGTIYVADTNNNRIQHFSSTGEFLNKWGGLSDVTAGNALPGTFNQPWAIAISQDGKFVYVADTWNQRVQVFTPDATGVNFTPSQQFNVDAWFSQSVENKPFLAVDESGHIFITDPEGYRVLEFNADGSFLRGWGSYSANTDGFGLPAGIAVDAMDSVWVSDAANNVLLHFAMSGK